MTDAKVTPASNPKPLDVDAAAGLYVEVRDEIAKLKAELKEKIKPLQAGLEKLDGLLLKHLQDQKAQSVKTVHGTVYQRIERSATIRDKLAFSTFVKERDLFDLIDWRANKVQVFDYMEKNQADVPGVNTSAFMTIGVLRGDSSKQEE